MDADGRHHAQGTAARADAHAQRFHHGLDRNGIAEAVFDGNRAAVLQSPRARHFAADHFEQRRQLRGDFVGGIAVTCAHRFDHLRHRAGNEVAHHRDHAGCADLRILHHRQRQVVVAGHDGQLRAAIFTVQTHAFKVAGRLFDRRKRDRVVVQKCQIRSAQFSAAAAGNDVRNQRDAGHVVGDAFVIFGAQFQARRPIVIAVDHQRGAGTGVLGMARCFDRFFGAVGTGSREHADAVVGVRDGFFNDEIVFGPAQRRRLAGRACRQDARDAFGDLEFNGALERFQIHVAVFEERRDERSPDSMRLKRDGHNVNSF